MCYYCRIQNMYRVFNILKIYGKRRFPAVSVKILYFTTPIVFCLNFAVYSKLSQMTLFKQVVKAQLAHTFVHDDCNRIGQIERARFFHHRYANRHIVVVVKKVFPKPFGLSAEKQEVVWRKMSLIVSYARFCGAKIEMRRLSVHCIAVYVPIAIVVLMYPTLRVLCKKFFEIFINYEIGQMPIVKPRAFQRLVADVEADRLNYMHLTSRCRRRSYDIACVLRNFRLDQNYIECHIVPLYFYIQSIFQSEHT